MEEEDTLSDAVANGDGLTEEDMRAIMQEMEEVHPEPEPEPEPESIRRTTVLPPEFDHLASIISESKMMIDDKPVTMNTTALSTDDIVTRNKLIRMIAAYRKEFSDDTKALPEPDLKSFDIRYLQSVLEQHRFLVSDTNSASLFGSFLMMTSYLVEQGGAILGLKTAGYSASLFAQPAYVRTCHELAIEVSMEYQLPPIQRFVLLSLYQLFVVHRENSRLATLTLQGKTGVTKALVDKFEKL